MDWFRLKVSKAVGKTIAITPLQPFKVFHLHFFIKLKMCMLKPKVEGLVKILSSVAD